MMEAIMNLKCPVHSDLDLCIICPNTATGAKHDTKSKGWATLRESTTISKQLRDTCTK